MLETYKNLAPLADSRISEADCISTYQDNQSPIAFATLFVNHFGALKQLSESYWGITGADKASFCLEELHRAMLTYSPERGAKFLTYLLTCLKNRLRAETQALSYDKRKADYLLQESLSKPDDSEVSAFEIVDNQNPFAAAELAVSLQNNSDLTENERAYCAFFSTNTVHATASDFARRQGVSSATVHYIRMALRKKITAVMV